MEWQVEFNENHKYFTVTRAGLLSLEELGICLNDLIQHNQWKLGTPVLCDNRQLDLTQVNFDVAVQAGTIYQGFSAQLGESKVAMLMKSLCDFGLGRQIAALTEYKVDAEINTFQDEKKALTWLLEKD